MAGAGSQQLSRTRAIGFCHRELLVALAPVSGARATNSSR